MSLLANENYLQLCRDTGLLPGFSVFHQALSDYPAPSFLQVSIMRFSRILIATAMFFTIPVPAQQPGTGAFKLGFGVDRGLGVVGSISRLNGSIGNKGFAIDYIFQKDVLNIELPGSTYWYLGGGGYHDWDDRHDKNDDDTGIRLPIGAEWVFADRLDAFAQVMPRLRLNNNTSFGLDLAIGVRYSFE